MPAQRVALTYGSIQKVRPYADALRESGLEPVLIAASDGIDSLEPFAGLLLSGGSDIDPRLYGEEADARTHSPDSQRDALELTLLRQAVDLDKPVLAICRGMQLFNVAHAGGTLHQHIQGHEFRPSDASLPAHAVAVLPGTMLASIAGESELQVNSRHHQAVSRVGAKLRVSAVALDGVIEGLERTDLRFAVAVQWHPEDQRRAASQRRLFTSFAAACGLVQAV